MAGLIGGMVSAHSHASSWRPKVSGATLASHVLAQLVRGEIESSLRLPSMCTLWFADAGHEDVENFPIGESLLVEMQDAADMSLGALLSGPDANPPLFDGEIVAIEAVREGLTTYTVVRAYDRLHRLYRGRRSKAYLSQKYGDIARQVAAEAGLTPGTIDDAHGAIVHDVVFQHDESGGQLLERFAAEYGFVMRVRGTTFDFTALPRTGDAPASAGSFGGASPDKLVLGDDLFRYEIGLSAENLVSDVEVRGWDAKHAKAVVGTASVSAAKSVNDPTLSAAKAKSFLGRPTTFSASGLPLNDIGEATHTAESIASHIASSYATVRGTSMGNKMLRAGKPINIGPDNTPFSGRYVITSARHLLEEGQYTTDIVCAGLTDLGEVGTLGLHDRAMPTAVAAPAPGVMPAVVTTNNDPLKQGRVKVKMDQIAEPFESDWLRVASPGVGKNRGFNATPEVGDEVVVAFEQGDMRRGYVLGGLWNANDAPEQAAFKDATAKGFVNKRSWTSRVGHRIVMDDTDGSESIELKTGDENLWVKLDQKAGSMTIDIQSSQSKLTMDKKGNITIEGQGNISLKATRDLEMKAMNVTISADQNIQIKAGMNASLEGGTEVLAKGGMSATLQGAKASVTGQMMAEISAAMVKIN